MPKKNVVLVVGMGTIGLPLIGLLLDLRKTLNLGEVIFTKSRANHQSSPEIRALQKRGASFAIDYERFRDFRNIGIEAEHDIKEALRIADVVVDCTPSRLANDLKVRMYSAQEDVTKGFIAQGGANGFGVPFIHGINDEVIDFENETYLQVLSCNTHAISSIIHAVAVREGKSLLKHGFFVCNRRDNDIGQASNTVASPTVNAHDYDFFGTHHASDVCRVFQTINLSLDVVSSAMKLPTRFMHVIHFNLSLSEPLTIQSLLKCLKHSPFIATTLTNNTGQIFSYGRDHGPCGRILNHAVVPVFEKALWVSKGGQQVAGFAFTPQDGNSLMSSLAAVTRFLNPNPQDAEPLLQRIRSDYLFSEI